MSFQQAVQNTAPIAECYRNGLLALGNHSLKITPSVPRSCSGSIDLDTCLQPRFPNATRWDYALGYGDYAYFVEVHPASGQVSEMLNKVTWLRQWLKGEGALLAAIHHPGKTFHWLSTNGVKIMGKYQLQLALNKVVVANHLILP